MKFNLKKPCSNCPFRYDVPAYLNRLRAEEIVESIVDMQQSFPCHKTTVADEDDEHGEDMMITATTQHCAGALIMLEHMEQPNQMMRIAERLGLYDRRALDMNAPVFDDADNWIDHQDH